MLNYIKVCHILLFYILGMFTEIFANQNGNIEYNAIYCHILLFY